MNQSIAAATITLKWEITRKIFRNGRIVWNRIERIESIYYIIDYRTFFYRSLLIEYMLKHTLPHATSPLAHFSFSHAYARSNGQAQIIGQCL